MFIVGLFYCFGAAQKREAGEVILNCIGLELVLLEQINKFRFFGNDLVLSYADVILLGASQIPIDTNTVSRYFCSMFAHSTFPLRLRANTNSVHLHQALGATCGNVTTIDCEHACSLFPSP